MLSSPKFRVWLRQNLAIAFNGEELKTLCFSLGLDYENIVGPTKDATTREIVLYIERLGRIPDLLAACAKLRPNIQWRSDFSVDKLTKPELLSAPPDEFAYDAFVSYAITSATDTDWVWQSLIPSLTAANLRIAVSGDMEELGVVQIVAKERGIRQARRTLIILSTDYLTDNMADFENTLAQSVGVQEGAYRLLPIKIAPVDETRLPARLSMLAALDLTNPMRIDRQFERLIRSLRQPLPRRTNEGLCSGSQST